MARHASAQRPTPARSACSTAARGTRSGSTSSARCWPSCCFDELHERIGLVGHSHVALSFERQEGQPATGAARRADETVDVSAGSWLLNPGSVGQPRDGDPRAAWLMLDLTSDLASWHRTEYDIDGAAAAIRAARLPDSLAERLHYGQ